MELRVKSGGEVSYWICWTPKLGFNLLYECFVPTSVHGSQIPIQIAELWDGQRLSGVIGSISIKETILRAGEQSDEIL